MIAKVKLKGLRIFQDRLLVNASYIAGNLIVTSFSGLLFWTIASRMYSDSEVGIASSVISIAQLLQFVGILGFGIGLLRYLADDNSPAELFNSVILFSLSATLLLGMGYLLLVPLFFPTMALILTDYLSRIAFILLISLMVILVLCQAVFIAMREARYSFYPIVIMNISRLSTIFLLPKYGAWGIVGALILGYLIAVIVSTQVLLPKVLPEYKFNFRINWIKIKNMFSFSLGNYISIVFRQSPRSVTAPMALEILGSSFSAYVYMAWTLVTFVSGLGIGFSNSALVEIVHSPNDFKRLLMRAFYMALIVTLPSAVLVYFFSPYLLGIFGPNYVKHTGELLRLMLISSPLVVINNIWLSYLRIKKYINEIIISSAIIIIVSVGYPYLFIESLGLNSIGIGWNVSQLLVILFLGFSYWLKKDKPKSDFIKT